MSSYLSLAAIENADLLAKHVQPILDSVISGKRGGKYFYNRKNICRTVAPKGSNFCLKSFILKFLISQKQVMRSVHMVGILYFLADFPPKKIRALPLKARFFWIKNTPIWI